MIKLEVFESTLHPIIRTFWNMLWRPIMSLPATRNKCCPVLLHTWCPAANYSKPQSHTQFQRSSATTSTHVEPNREYIDTWMEVSCVVLIGRQA